MNHQENFNDDRILKGPNFTYSPHPYGVGYAFYESMTKYKNLTAQINTETGMEDSYGSLLQRSIRISIRMQDLGITSGDVVSSCAYNHLNSCVPFIAASFIGAIYAGLEPSLHLTDTIYLLKQICPKIIFVANEAIELIEEGLKDAELNTKIICFEKSNKYDSIDDFLEALPNENIFVPVKVTNLFETVAMFFSSGTTGLPKGICVNHYTLLAQSFNISHLQCNYKRILIFSTLYCGTAAFFLTHSILFGRCRIVDHKFNPDTVWNIMKKLKPTVLFISPYIALIMNKIGRPKEIDLSQLSAAFVGGGPYSFEQAVEFKSCLNGAPVYCSYGLTEAIGIVYYHICDKSGWIGNAMPGIWYKIVDFETEKLVRPHQRGELRLKTKFIMNGYYKQDSSDAWDKNGWIKTGDIAYYDENSTIYVIERMKEMLKFQSWPFSPTVLEEVLLKHPAVKKAVVIGLPHNIDGDHAMGLVVLQDQNTSVVELLKYVNERVDVRQQLRGGLTFIDDVPTTPSGKVKRRELRQLVIEGNSRK